MSSLSSYCLPSIRTLSQRQFLWSHHLHMSATEPLQQTPFNRFTRYSKNIRPHRLTHLLMNLK